MKELSTEQLRVSLRACLAVPRWIDEVVAQAPFTSPAELLRAAREAATPLSRAEVAQALAEHPRISRGEHDPADAGDPADADDPTDAGDPADADDARLAVGIADGNRAYEERFGRVFLIRAAGRSRLEILTELRRRLGLDDDTEAGIVASELRDIALIRLAALVGEAGE